jgi:hypothetical protein
MDSIAWNLVGLNLFRYATQGVSDKDLDMDNDHLSNVIEKDYGTDPTVFELNLRIALNWNADSTYLSELQSGLQQASDFLYDATDGYLYFRVIEIYNNVISTDSAWTNANIRIEEGTADERTDTDPHWPQATVGTNGAVFFPQYFDADEGGWGAPSHPHESNWYRTLVHELGHARLNLLDEYIGPSGDAECENVDDDCCIMDNSYDRDELCTPLNHDPDGDTRQTDLRGESCWETFVREYCRDIPFDLDRDGIRDPIVGQVPGGGDIAVLNDYHTILNGPTIVAQYPYMLIFNI